MTSPIAEQLTERFFRYLAVTSQSNAAATALPSTPGQHEMAQLLAEELRRLGLADVQIDDHATVTARKPGTQPGAPRRASASSPISTPWTSACRPRFARSACASSAKMYA